jgi:hypothetical protein
MLLVIRPDGTLITLYTEALPLADFGTPRVSRASHVEPTDAGEWQADLSPVNGPTLGPYSKRSHALEAEAEWIETHLPEIAARP